ncbi:2-amino-4-hydroxy-6-hydroxymethyldihydropteridine diphosphokinase [Brevundimonas sp.]|uniref:2-amino-4-hydroxy-6- hydroxymethyldihydropteridine diphosphokinase n=2 Tax=Brevundimonas sp. TaxID=1871086 RepID=UPI0027FF8A35|nr:2-amino-4-hydroxy-6-hydroxymethyldihydropteridine diphosphokinase [Brevundimonas sp.]MDQ7812319.1 2-amino-4-hydroxy-6-hydroxymethyldihydropteridine diphosphokinase [Brevundimonas sp.]
MEISSDNMDVPVSVEMDGDLDLDAAVIVALGCNDKGAWRDCREALEAALARFRSEGIDVLLRSSWWRSRAWPDPDDPPFLNGVVIVRTAHDPHALMAALGRIEEAFGRRRDARNAPRTLDLDLIAYGRLSGDLDGLILPHPRAADRKFVMGPLAEIAPTWEHPGGGRAADLAHAAPIGRDAAPAR